MFRSIVAMMFLIGCAGVSAGDWHQPRSGMQGRSASPAWGQTPSGVPREVPRQGRTQLSRDDGYPDIRRDRQRWRDNPNDRHESRRRDDWHDQGRDDDRRGGRRDWDDDDRERRGGVVRRRDRDDDHRHHDGRYDDHDDGRGGWPPAGYGPYGPTPGYDDHRGPYDYRWRRYDD